MSTSTWVGDCLICDDVYLDGTGAATRMWAKRHAEKTGHTTSVECTSTRFYRADPTADDTRATAQQRTVPTTPEQP